MQFVLRQRFFRAIKHAPASLDCRYRSDVGVVASHKRPLNPHLTRHHQRLAKNRCGETSPPEIRAHRIPDVTSDTQKLFRKRMQDRHPTNKVVVYERRQECFRNLSWRQSLS